MRLSGWLYASVLVVALCGCGQREPVQRGLFTITGAEGEGIRGGITTGVSVTPLQQPSDAWQALQEPGLSSHERDRRAILAMTGTYRVDFSFVEAALLVPDLERDRPYHSWATETIFVIEDVPDRIVLQHILCMFFRADDGSIEGPAVIKHWRQDWTWQDQEILSYIGHDRWQKVSLEEAAVQGSWTQAVWGVVDEPRYETVGRWVHDNGHSYWQAEPAWRPLPRREFSVRDDYHVLKGENTHRINPFGWTHEQKNIKTFLSEDGDPVRSLAVEVGHNDYRLLVDFDDSAAREYWDRTSAFWAAMRTSWRQVIDQEGAIRVTKKVDDHSLIFGAFEQAEQEHDDPSAAAQEIIDRHVSSMEDAPGHSDSAY